MFFRANFVFGATFTASRLAAVYSRCAGAISSGVQRLVQLLPGGSC